MEGKYIKHSIEEAMEAGGGAFERARLGGINNRGASMSVRHGCAEGKLHNCCCINIYVNSNIQGVSNSTLNGSEVKMGSPRVCFIFDPKAHQNPNQWIWLWLWLLGGAGLLLILIVVMLLFLLATPKLGMFHS